ncbi:MAG: anthranilate phosphoribosyltransferase [Acidimicrobiia bacterium]
MDFEGTGGWPTILGALTARRDLDREVATAAMGEILSGGATPAQIAAFAVALRLKGETVEELSGMVSAMLAAGERVDIDVDGPVIDVVGTGGDRAHTINVSTLSALVVAGAGGTVCKHGGRAASSSCGAADLLEALGVVIDLDPAGVARCVAEAGMGFCFAPRFHPAMRHAGPPRREIGIPTVFNFLGPLSNPGRVRRYLIGVADLSMAERMLGVLAANGAVRAMVVHGGDGLDELTTTGPSQVLELRDGAIEAYELDPAGLGLPTARREDLVGGTPEVNAEIARAVLAGKPGAPRDIVLLNAAAGLVVAGLVEDVAAGLVAAAEAVDSGAAAGVLDRLVETSQGA